MKGVRAPSVSRMELRHKARQPIFGTTTTVDQRHYRKSWYDEANGFIH